MAACSIKVGNIKVFFKHWTNSDHQYNMLTFIRYVKCCFLLKVKERTQSR